MHCSLYKEDDVDNNDEEVKDDESLVVSEVSHVQVLRYLFFKLLLPRLLRNWFRRN